MIIVVKLLWSDKNRL